VRVVSTLSLLLITGVAVSFVPSAEAAFHLELGGALMHFDAPRPISVDSSGLNGFPSASDLYGLGPGFKAGASLDLGRRFAVAALTGLLQVQSEHAVVLVPAEFSGPVPPEFPGTFNHELTMVPTHLVARYRLRPGPKYALHGQLGIGVTAFTEKSEIITNDGFAIRGAAYQTSFSMLTGVGGAYDVYRGLAIDAGLDFYLALPGKGEIWRNGDKPWFGVATLGLRYPL
jgi:hypothetical protein